MEKLIVLQWVLMILNSASFLLILIYFDRLIGQPIPRFSLTPLIQQFKSLIPDAVETPEKRERRERINEFLANEALAKRA